MIHMPLLIAEAFSSAALALLPSADWQIWVITALAVVAGLLVLLAIGIERNFPRDDALTATDEHEVDDDLLDLLDAYQQIGFELVGPAYRVRAQIPGVLIALVNRQGDSYATIFRISPANAPTVVSYDVGSDLEGGGGLTTVPTKDGAVLPARMGQFKQVFVKAPPQVLYERHSEALDWLRTQGIRAAPASRERFLASMQADLAAARRHFRRNWPWHTIILLWRMATGRSPFIGPLAQQPAAARMVERLSQQQWSQPVQR